MKYYISLAVAPETEDLDKILSVQPNWIETPLSREEIHSRLDLMLDMVSGIVPPDPALRMPA